MATTTTNYGFDIPQSTDLVKDGATAIATLGQDIDTAMNTALGTKKAGMVLLNTTSFSGVSSQAVNPFSATYDNFRIIITLTASSGNPTITFRIRNGATDKTASDYYFGGFNSAIGGGTVGSYRGNGSSSWTIGDIASGSANRYLTVMDILNPFTATVTKASYSGTYSNASDSFGYGVGAFILDSSSYDGYDIIASTGTLTGKVVTYGYNL